LQVARPFFGASMFEPAPMFDDLLGSDTLFEWLAAHLGRRR
jgi:hypothetical protein